LDFDIDRKPYFKVDGENYFGNDLANQFEDSRVIGTLRERCEEVLEVGKRYFSRGRGFYEDFYLINRKEEDIIKKLRKKYCKR